MKKTAWFGFLMLPIWLVGCDGTYKSPEVSYPPVPQSVSKLTLEVNSPKGVDKKESESFRESIISELQKRGFVITSGTERQLKVEIVGMKKDNHVLGVALTVGTAMFPGPGALFLCTSSNALVVKASLQEQEKTTEFGEFQEYKENTKEWEDMKRLVAHRIADAVYFATR